MKVALVYDRVNKWGGAERVIIALRKIFPDSVLFTSVYKEDRASWARKIPVKTSFLQKIPFASSHHEVFATLMPVAFESFDFSDFDLVISLTSEAAKGIITKPQTKHISIILTPTRYLWSGHKDYFSNPIFRIIIWPVVSYLRFWDKIAARRPDKLIAISETVQSRIKKYYGLESEVIYPPLMMRPLNSKSEIRNPKQIQNSKFKIQNYFLIVSRLVPYKRIDLAVKAANKVRAPLKIIGTGSEFDRLKKMAGPTVDFLGYVSDSDLKYYYANCKTLVFPGVEDFGLTMVEAQTFDKPVIAFRGGGAEEIIVEGKTGVFFDKQTVQSLASKLKSFRASRYNGKDCRKNANRFSFERFKAKILGIL
ncbi:MAG: hypothetical protein A3C30_00375 [Candidatus Levybacteria bacterium RIFCSPHIGHO2_02_FULL_40_18]|nr:MAG: hypothetical protein A2869_04070 [Candidatus Levybacteria bacterium RIFCSPHIGHO2_01_FULL_40_58]OGH27159.1 MAG: hypothetical protein A3C30_00375 [Candidatus Levybacteria bacterium RIFCSPHIGHO2_02_FULL_40_18]OGH31018.1 MAG: hypothetical protein A3E43_04790 [Candidatus Levybacteria bacterium RIFCSPHIGHO2_12_FULL_40_31]OGH41029.1 MAG: hypothetical protein A2894_02005 [Candidatus Levybacteria bacterium RIFCSPLOWO2_01_FULL_40_64]OGH49449.1 MAG: hypothetical protein A3I54_02290 [Candidatus Lev